MCWSAVPTSSSPRARTRRAASASSRPCELRRGLRDRRGVGMALLAVGLVWTVSGRLRAGRAADRARPVSCSAAPAIAGGWSARCGAPRTWRSRAERLEDAEAALQEARAVVGETERQSWIAVTVGDARRGGSAARRDERAPGPVRAGSRALPGRVGSETGAEAMEARLQSLAKDRQRPRKGAAGRTARHSDNKTEAVMSTTITPVLGEATVQELREAIHGSVLRPDDDGYAEACRIWNGAFDGRRPALIVGCSGAADVIAAVGFARSNDLRDRGSRRRPQHRRVLQLRRRDRDRPLGDALGARRPAGTARIRRRRRGLERRRPRDTGARARDDRRARLDHRRRRLHARRRHRLADAQARPRLRQPHRRRRGHRRRAARARQRDARTPTCSGACAAAAATSASSPSSSSRCTRSDRRSTRG